MLARAILAGASGQIRNMATVGGNILQRTRCSYFYDNEGSRCNKRQLEQGCDAIEGFNRNHAILGASSACVATHPSDMCVALAALDAIVHVQNSEGMYTMPFNDLHLLPGDTPNIETMLHPDDLITAIELPPMSTGMRSTYRKVRDRSSYAFALVSVAATLDLGADGTINKARIALGGVAHKPWRAGQVEAALQGQLPNAVAFATAAAAELAAARPLKDNGFKIELAQRLIVAVLEELTAEMAI